MAQFTHMAQFDLYCPQGTVRYVFYVTHTKDRALVHKLWNGKPLSDRTTVRDTDGHFLFTVTHESDISIHLARDFWNFLTKIHKFTQNIPAKTA